MNLRALAVALLLSLAAIPSAFALGPGCAGYPFTLTNGQTADANQVMANFNLIRNCTNSNTAASGANSDITSLLGLTTPLPPGEGGSSQFVGGTTGGSASAMTLATVTPSNFTLTTGYIVDAISGFTNTGAVTLAVNGTAATNILKRMAGGLAPLAPGDFQAGQQFEVFFDGIQYELMSVMAHGFVTESTVALSTTTPLSTTGAGTNIIDLTGSGITVTSFGNSANTANPLYFLRFSGASTLTNNAISLILPGFVNITTGAGDAAVAKYEGSGNWRILIYAPASGAPAGPGPAALFSSMSVSVTSSTGVSAGATTIQVSDALNHVLTVTSVSLSMATGLSGSCTVGVANCLDTGTVAASTWYNVWDIFNPVTSTNAGLLSLSATSPTLPSGFTYQARLGAIRTNASGVLLGTLQKGRHTQYVIGGANLSASIAMSSGATTNSPAGSAITAAISLANFVPPTASKISMIMQSGNALVAVAPDNGYGSMSSTTVPPPCVTAESGAQFIPGICELPVDGTKIFWGSSNTGGQLFVMGWDDNL